MKKIKLFGEFPHHSLKKTLMIMRFAIIFLVLGIVQAHANDTYSQKTRLSINFSDTELVRVLDKIENESEFFFLYNEKLLDTSRKVSINIKNQLIGAVLDQLFNGTDVKYTIIDRKIILAPEYLTGEPEITLRKITGTVSDKNGLPLPGVNVFVTGTSQGTTTDAAGKYSIDVPQEARSLTFSYIGMEPQEIIIGDQSQIDLTMRELAIGLNEIVVVGYGTQRKATVTGAISTIKSSELQKAPTTNLSSALTGQMTGVVVNTRGSAPGTESVQINIRGKSTWQGGGNPLIIIDGIANRPGFERMDPNDIESISVLKDASAAIYGSRAANGVILVTTKRGKEGKPTIEYTGDYGLTKPTRVPEMARSWQFAKYFTEAKRNGYMWTDEEIAKFEQGASQNLFPNYDFKDYMLQSVAPQTTQTLSLSGGNSSVKYYVSGRYLYQDSYFKNGIDDFNGYSIRANIDAKVTKNLSVAVDLLGRRDDTRRAVGSGNVDNIDIGFFEELITLDPTKPVFFENGLPAPIYGNNVVEQIKGHGGEKNNRNNTVNSRFSAKWDLPFITKGLFLEGTAAYDMSNLRTKEFSKSYDLYAYSNATGEYTNLNNNPTMNRSLYDYYYSSYRYTLDGKLGYIKSFGNHNISSFIAYEQYAINTEWIQATRSTFLSDQIPYQFAGDANTQKNDGSGSEYAYRNVFGRVAYDFKEKYMVDFTLRRDESLKFPKDKRVGWFPGISAGWKLSEESFIKDNIDFVDNLKLRASFGQMGSDNVGDYQYMATAALYGTFDSYVFGTNPSVVSTLYFTGTPNPNITWEVANSYNVGLDGSLWNGLLGFELDYFLSKRSNILAARNASVPFYTGMTLPYENIGKAQNQGFEILLTHRRKVGDFSYGASGNFTFMANKVIFMDESPNVPDYQRREGHPIDSYLLFQTDGIFNTQEEFDATEVKRAGAQVGDIKYIDVNGDKVIDNLDQVRLFDSSLPKIIYGLNLNLSYKGFDLTMLWQGQADAKTYINPTTRNGDINIPLWMYDNRWTPENQENATMPRAFYHRSESYNSVPSDFWLKDASFLRLKTLELAYNLPAKIVSKIACNNARIYVSGFNLLLFDKIKNYDPEIVNDLGVFYPATKVFNMGIRVTF
jgi:TonB-dependent starch-binding outer membrane protein SusC